MKRLVSVILALAVFLPAILFGVPEVGSFCQNVFADADLQREQTLSEACGQSEPTVSSRFFTETEEREGWYIVRFSDTLAEQELLALLEGTSYTLLSDSAERVFSVCLRDVHAFREACGDALLYCCADHSLQLEEVPDDPLLAEQPMYQQAEIFSAWESVVPKRDLIVAVLDTGVDRSHEDLEGTVLLNGYDAVTHTLGVADDPDGHGTSVIGLIAAAQNGKGIAGVAYGVQILPIRVGDGANSIYSSNLIRGIRFAADAGAKILNLSLGAYTYSAAEYDAVKYALDRGCILIAAAGNDGEKEQGNKDVYPASYEGVISVGSCTLDGARSGFSQRSDEVDVLLPGENLTLLAADGRGPDAYRVNSGTSYATAVASGIAALALSALDDGIRLDGAEMLSLFADGRKHERGGVGYGTLSALRAVTSVNQPLITGVEANRSYGERVIIHFNRGEALLDGEPFQDGETVFRNGRHTLTVTDRGLTKTIPFRLLYLPSHYTVKEDADAVRITYSGGMATMDGFPYASGDAVTGRGWHLFRLTDRVGDVSEYPFFFDGDLPLVAGVQDGGVYDHPIHITLAGNGNALLDGVAVAKECVVTADGEHTLRVENGGASRLYRFTLQTGEREWENTMPKCGMIVDAEHDWYALYSETTGGMRVYEMSSGEYRSFIDVAPVLGYVFTESGLALFGKKQITLLDASVMQDGGEPIVNYSVNGTWLTAHGGEIYCLSEGALQTVSLEDGSLTVVCETDADELYSDQETLWLYRNADNTLFRYDQTEGMQPFTPALSLSGVPKQFADGWLFCGTRAMRLDDLSVRFSFSGNALLLTDELLLTSDGAYRLEDGVKVGIYGAPVSCLVQTEEGVYLCGKGGGIRFCPNGFGYAPLTGETITTPAATNAYTDLLSIYGAEQPVLLKTAGERLCVALTRSRKLLLFRNREKEREVDLPFRPDGVLLTETNCYAWETQSGLLWTDGVLLSTGIRLGAVLQAESELYLLGEGQLYRLADGVLTETGIPADQAVGFGRYLCRLYDDRLYLGDGMRTLSISCQASSLCTDGIYAVADRNVYRLTDGSLACVLPEQPLAVCSGYALTANGLYALESGEQLFVIDTHDGMSASLSGRYGVIFCTGSMISVSGYEQPIWETPSVSGISENSLMQAGEVLRYDRGTGYLDGVPFASGSKVEQAGEHIFLLVLPCGRVEEIPFTLVPNLAGIAFATPVYRLAAGESGVLRVQYLPSGTHSVPLVFSCDGDCIRLAEDGSFSALHDGEATVTAQTTDGMFRATCRVVVTATLLRFAENSGYRIDREGGRLLGVPAGLRAEQLLEQVVSEGEARASKDYIGTGTVLTLHSAEGEELDRLTVVVSGDLDGDGFVTLQDLLLLERSLEEGFSDDLTLLAGDLSGNLESTDQDANLLRKKLLFAGSSSSNPTPPTKKSGRLELFLPSVVCAGDVMQVTVYLRDGDQADCAGCYGASGRLFYDASVMTYLGRETYGWNVSMQTGDEWLSFLASGEDADGTLPLVTFRFRLHQDAKDVFSKLRLRDGVLLDRNGVCGLHSREYPVQPTERKYGPLSLQIKGMTATFREDRMIYDVLLPGGTPGLDYSATYPEDCTLTVYQSIFDRSDELEAMFVFQFEDGKSCLYTVRARRDGKRPPNSNSRLASLTVDGFPFTFDPDVTTYRLQVPYETERLQIRWETEHPSASAVLDERALLVGQETVITVTVTAQDGSQTVYTLLVARDRKPPDTDDSTVRPPAPTEPNRWGFLSAGLLCIVCANFCLLLGLHQKRKKKQLRANTTEKDE